ncbi:glycosyltransferase family 2 protein [Niabella hibiscisoli]|uniref:glycosyltransferase family 2 protein n=1 Tax=Niabella hibiscisoli TaxID=1825928 RepID=UPI001F0D57DC|nr:glycosyltransferase family 2 protein [Niabella hibiscisoli]MCH5720425.1 glycosyltransferase [Niabella hibiscisoli]
MHYIFSYPDWVKHHKYSFGTYDEISNEVFDSINKRLDSTQSATPVVSILIAAWNEETNILNCVSSLSASKTKYPFEIIVINNNSTDQTQKTLDKLHVKALFQPVQGCGPARQLGQETALGDYILLADADCIYAEGWIEEMMNYLTKPGVVCVYGRYSFIPEQKYPRWQLYIFEKLKDVIAELRHFKRPYLNAYGISMGYVKNMD